MYELNPTGGFFDRIYACWMLFRYPQEFINGVIQNFCDRLSASLSSEIEARATAAVPPTAPVMDIPSPELEEAAIRAQNEVMNG